MTDRDIAVRAVAEGVEAETPVERVMTRQLIVVEPSDEFEDALSLMRERQVRRLLVVEGDGSSGIVAQADIARSHRGSRARRDLAKRFRAGGDAGRAGPGN